MNSVSAKICTDCKFFLSSAALLFCLLAAQQLSAQSAYTVTDIGPVNDLNDPVAGGAAINNGGAVVGQQILPSDPDRAFLWVRGTVFDLGTLGGQESGAASVNALGQIVGNADTADGTEHCFLWDQGNMTDLLTLGGDLCEANHINARGQIVGLAATDIPDPTGTIGPQEAHAFLCPTGAVCTAGGMQDLQTLGGPNSVAIGINSTGQVVGWSQIDFNIGDFGIPDLHAATWTNGVITRLPDLGGPVNLAIGVNDQGVAVGMSFFAGDFPFHAVMWQNGNLSDLGTLPGDLASQANGINKRGQVVGVSFDDNFVARAFLLQNGVMTDLNKLIPAGSDWFLIGANEINEMGQIVGNGFLSGSLHAFLLTPSAGGGKTGSASAPPSVPGLLQSLIWGRTGLLKHNLGLNPR